MACNCATTEQLNELYRKYGEKKAEKKSFGIRVRNAVYKVGVAICLIPIVPMIILYAFYKAWGTDDHYISVAKIFKFKRKEIGANVRQ